MGAFVHQHSPATCLTHQLSEKNMNKQILRMKSRGASMVEYALLLVAVLLLAAAAFKALGPVVGRSATNATQQL